MKKEEIPQDLGALGKITGEVVMPWMNQENMAQPSAMDGK